MADPCSRVAGEARVREQFTTNRSADPSSASSTLLERVKRRQPEAWRRLVRPVRAAGLPLVPTCSTAGQRCGRYRPGSLRRRVTHIDTFHRQPGEGSFRAWLSTITRNKVHDFYRRQRGQVTAHGGSDAYERLVQIPEPEALTQATSAPDDRQLLSRRALAMVRAEFESRTWEAFRRAVLEGQRPAHVAQDLGMSVNAVYKSKSRILRRLRQELGEL